jgi:hypothetical protein
MISAGPTTHGNWNELEFLDHISPILCSLSPQTGSLDLLSEFTYPIQRFFDKIQVWNFLSESL